MAQARWHQALVFALLGERRPSLGAQSQPDTGRLLADLDAERPGGLTALRDSAQSVARTRRAAAAPWPIPVPDDLRQELGAAQFSAALADLISRLGLQAGSRPAVSSRPLDAAERRLLRDVPPHHGS